MEKKTISLKELKKRKMLLILPVLALPFVTMFFWSLGGGKNTRASGDIEEKKGFNSILPNPKFKEDISFDKLSYYNQAALDSIKLQEQLKKDPNYSDNLLVDDSVNSWEDKLIPSSFRKGKVALNTTSYKDQNEQKVYQKLKALQKAISQPSTGTYQDQDMREFENYGSSDPQSADMKKLEQMMNLMNEPQEPDPELKELGGMLENILDIQHPARMQEKLRQSTISKKGKSLKVVRKNNQNNVTSLNTSLSNQEIVSKSNSFYTLDEVEALDEQQNSIEAVIHETQRIVNGSTVKLRLSNDVLIEGIQIPKNTFLFGIAALKGERLEVKIDNIQYRNSIFPVELAVYDLDGIDGIYIPGAINRDVAKVSADRSIQTLGLTGLQNSWGSQAAGMGIEAAKSLMSKKVKLIKVVLKAGYQVLLYDEKQKNLNN